MMQLTDEQLNNLNKEALVIIASSLQSQLGFMLELIYDSQATHNSIIGRALAYSINQEEYLRVFLNDGKIPMDNNYAEQGIRPFTIVRKNFVRIESSQDANASAMIFSLSETTKATGLNTYQYFKLLLTKRPLMTSSIYTIFY